MAEPMDQDQPSSSKPRLQSLALGSVSERKRAAASEPGAVAWPGSSAPTAGSFKSPLELIRSQSAGRLKFAANEEFEFNALELVDEGEIGQGAYGTVSRMLHQRSGRVMAVKRIRSAMEEREQKRLLMDLEVIMRSDTCEYIVQFFGADFREGYCWICMELMDTSLEKLYKLVYDHMQSSLPEEIIGKIAFATLSALVYLKDNLKIIHRDVKPSNILLDRQGRIKLCDFGIAGQLVDSIAKTRDAGCRPYMAPERLSLTTSKYDVRSDVWSLGITLVEIGNGSFPYPAWSSVFEQLQQVVQGDPPSLAQPDRFSNDFVLFVSTCLTKEEDQRPKYVKLLGHRFIRRFAQAPVDVGGYVADVLDAAPKALSPPTRLPMQH